MKGRRIGQLSTGRGEKFPETSCLTCRFSGWEHARAKFLANQYEYVRQMSQLFHVEQFARFLRPCPPPSFVSLDCSRRNNRTAPNSSGRLRVSEKCSTWNIFRRAAPPQDRLGGENSASLTQAIFHETDPASVADARIVPRGTIWVFLSPPFAQFC